MSSSSKRSDVSSGLSKLTLDSATKSSKNPKLKSKKIVVESWEDEDISSASDSDGSTVGAEDQTKEGLSAPPPTPISPTYKTAGEWSANPESTSPTLATYGDSSPSRRPEKTDAVARRMIASALGVKAPKQTEEQKAYDKAIREQEKKRREAEKAAEKDRHEQTEKAKAAIWDD
jgi:hypothetical protein